MGDFFRAVTNSLAGPMAPTLHSMEATAIARWPERHTILADAVRDEETRSTFEAPTSPAFGGVNALGSILKFRLDNADRPLRQWLELVVGAPTGTPGTYIRLVSGAPVRMLGRVQLLYQNKIIYEAMPRELFYDLLHSSDEKARDIRSELYLALTAGVRSTLATGSQTFRIPIPTYWRLMIDEALSPILRSLTEAIELRITLGSIGDVLETDYTNPSLAITSAPQLRFERETNGLPTRAALNALVQNGNGVMNLMKEWETTRPSTQINAGTTLSDWLPVTSLRRESSVWYILFRLATADTAYSGTYFDFDSAYLPTSIEVRTANGQFIPEIPVAHLIRKNYRRFFTASEFPIIPVVLAEDIESGNQASGSIDFTYLQDLQVRFRWAVATPANYVVDLDTPAFNFVQAQGTQIQRIGN